MWGRLLNADLETPLAARDDLDDVVALLVKSRIDPQKFVGNLSALLSFSMPDLFGVAASSSTPSIRQYKSVLNRPPTVPLWLIAAFPDVLTWFNEKQRDVETTARLLGIDFASAQDPEEHFENADGTLRARYYGNLVSNYAKETGKALEAAVPEGTENDIYLAEGLVQIFGEESNFTLIATKTTKYYLELKRTHGSSFPDETSLLAMAGMLDAKVYILETQQITPTQILKLARETEGMQDRFLHFLVRFEAVLLSVDNPELSRDEVRSACDDQAPAIRRAIQRTMDTYRGEPVIAALTALAMSSPEFATFRRISGIPSSLPPPLPSLPSSSKTVRVSPLEKFGLVVIGFVGALFVLYALILIFTVVGERETRRRLDNTNERRIDAVDFLDTTNPKSPAISNDAIRHAGEQKPSPIPKSSATPSEEQNAVEGKEVRKGVPVENRRAIPVEPTKP